MVDLAMLARPRVGCFSPKLEVINGLAQILNAYRARQEGQLGRAVLELDSGLTFAIVDGSISELLGCFAVLQHPDELKDDLVLAGKVRVGLSSIPSSRDDVGVDEGRGEVVDGNVIEEDVGNESSSDPIERSRVRKAPRPRLVDPLTFPLLCDRDPARQRRSADSCTRPSLTAHHLTVEDKARVVRVLLECARDSLFDSSIHAWDGRLLIRDREAFVIDLETLGAHSSKDFSRSQNAVERGCQHEAQSSKSRELTRRAEHPPI